MLADRYTLDRLLASGGMGDVHVARDERLGRKVAVKLLREELAASPDFVERFRREAVTAARLTHPGVARVLDYGQDGAAHYIVMELVEGEDLGRLLARRRRLPADEAVSIAAQVCDALAAAHTAGFVHRDIKPSNVIVTPTGLVKVTDFGIARALGGSSLTQTGMIMGTAQYVAPEQVRGEPAVPASDLYGVGVLTFQRLTGRVPFDGDSPVTVAMRHLDSEVPRPSSEVDGISPALDAVAARATAASVADRFTDAAQMAAALRASVTAATTVLQMGASAGSTQMFPAADASSHHNTRAFPVAAPSAASAHEAAALPPYRAGRAQPPRRRTPWIIAGLVILAMAAVAAFTLGDDPAPPAAVPPPTTPTQLPTTEQTPDGPVLPADLVGRDRASVVAEVIREGFRVRWTIVRSASPQESVIGTFPPPGSSLTPGQTIVLVVSRGSAPDNPTKWTVEDGLAGLDVDQATQQLKDQDVRVGTAPVASDQPKGTVLGTWPAAGEVTEDGVVVLVVASGDSSNSSNSSTDTTTSSTADSKPTKGKGKKKDD